MNGKRPRFAKYGIVLASLILILGVGVGVVGFLGSNSAPVGFYPSSISSPQTYQTFFASTSTATIHAGPAFGSANPLGSLTTVLQGGQNGGALPGTVVLNPGGTPSPTVSGKPTSSAAPVANQIEFFANLSLTVASPQIAVGKVESVAIEHGGYLAFSTVTNGSAYVIMRVPASDYHAALNEAQALGNVTDLITRSNDVTLKMTNLNATLQSLLTEKTSLLKILAQSTRVNDTLQIETQIQLIDSQVNSIESQILNTQRLIDYSTITVSLTKATAKVALSAKVSVTPKSGASPLAVTFHTSIKGGTPPFLVSYNFGDGTSAQGEVLIHVYVQPGDYDATITTTDSAGSVVEQSVKINVLSLGVGEAFSQFLGTAGSLFVRVVEGIVEVAAVTIPVVLALALVVPVVRRYLKGIGAGPVSQAPS